MVLPLNPTVSWTTPPVGYVKVNWDASINKHQAQMGVGVIVRDHASKVLAMLCAWTVVNLARRMELRNVVFEGDTLEIVQALNKEGNCWTTYGQIVNDAKDEIDKQQGWVVQYVSRLANGAAHHLAQLAFMHGEGREWRDDFPFYVQGVVPDDA